ncbi:hypothetical protein KFE94_00800 [bacterium SCSIO 12643]|nr:hypothetical protein KFE94_00800 [bacterium SCSIO 12643]
MMIKHLTKILILALLSITLYRCVGDQSKVITSNKFSEKDPFKETIVESEYFDIDAKNDTVVKGQKGTMIVLPKGCFINTKGEVVTSNVKLELAEALSLEEMVLSNLTTTSDGNLLETDGMIYLEATSNGERLAINKENPIYIEIPTAKKKSGMMAYKGIRDEDGNMNWVEPKELDKYLTPIDIELLDFYPDGFENAVAKNLPYKQHKELTKELVDSLYYSLSVSDGGFLTEGFVGTDYNEPYDNPKSRVVDGEYTKESYESEYGWAVEAAVESVDSECDCGIDPAIIKVIWDKKFENTLIATREFETRLQVIFKTCNNDILDIYVKNLDRNLWELDSAAALALGNDSMSIVFTDFAKQRLTKVKEGEIHFKLLKGYYEKQLKKYKSQLEKVKQKAKEELGAKNKKAEELADEYREVLFAREKHRMEAYGFEWTDTGWLNIDRGTIPKTWARYGLEVKVENGKKFDQVYTYVVYSSIKSIYRLNSSDNVIFHVGNSQNRDMLMPQKETAICIAIGYKDEKVFMKIQEFQTGKELKLKISLAEHSPKEVKKAIRKFNNYKQENRIEKDLEYMQLFYQERKRQEALKKEREFIQYLDQIARPCYIWIIEESDVDTLAYRRLAR